MDRLSTTRGIALYVGALLGPGLLVLPGLAAAQAGPASIFAWAGLLVLSGLVAVVFARFGIEHRSAGGVSDYVAAGLGERAGRAVGWCFLIGIITGAPIVCTLGAGYLTDSHPRQAMIGGAMLALLIALSRRGLRTSTGFQLALVAVLLVVLAVAVTGALPHAEPANFHPFAPHGWSSIGSAATVLMLSFIGWEAVAPLTDRFPNPRHQLPRVIGAAFAITAALYLALAAITIAALGPAAATSVPVGALLRFSLGSAGHVVAAITALLLTLGAVNAYLTGGSALARTLTPARRSAVPLSARRSAGPWSAPRDPAGWFWWSLAGSGVVILGLVGLGVISEAGAVTMPTSFVLVVYVACMISAARAMPGRMRWIASIAAAANLLILAYAGWAALPAIAVATVVAARGPRKNTVKMADPSVRLEV